MKRFPYKAACIQFLWLIIFTIGVVFQTQAQEEGPILATGYEKAHGRIISAAIIDFSNHYRDSIKKAIEDNGGGGLELPGDDQTPPEDGFRMHIFGPDSVGIGSVQSYNLVPFAQENMYWFISSGTVVSYWDDHIVIDFTDAEDTIYIKLFNWNDELTALKRIVVHNGNGALSAGSILTPSQSFLESDTVYNLIASNASGGSCSEAYQYQWQIGPDESDFSPLDVPYHDSLDIQLIVRSMINDQHHKKYIRRRVICGTDTLYAGPVGLFYLSDLNPGSIADSSYYFIPGQTNLTLRPSAATDGNCMGGYTYQWEYSYDNTYFRAITGETADSLAIDASLDRNIYFRRSAHCGRQVFYTNAVLVHFQNPSLHPVTNLSPAALQVKPLPPAYVHTPVSYAREFTALIPINDTASVNASRPVEEVAMATIFKDSYGRNLQTVARQQSPDKKDLVVPSVFDEFGRTTIGYLPYTAPSNDGTFRTHAFQEDSSFYKQLFPHEQAIYSQTIFDESILNLPTKNMAPGNSWVGSRRGTKISYRTNDANDSVQLWTIDIDTEDDLPQTTSYYTPGTLQVVTMLDENQNMVVKFTNELGQTILTRTLLRNSIVYGTQGWLNTYYVYDDWNRLRFVVPPKAAEVLHSLNINWSLAANQEVSNQLCYAYFYDIKGRVIMKRIPGKGKAYVVYDQRGRAVMTQDARLRNNQQWTFVKFDESGRPVKSGLINSNLSRIQLQEQANGSSDYPALTGIFTVTSETYYDQYDWITAQSLALATAPDTSNLSSDFSNNYNQAPEYAQPIRASHRIRGSITGTKTLILNSTQYLYTVNFYDRNGRSIQTQQTNITGGTDVSTIQYSFNGLVLRTRLQHQKAGNNPKQYTVLTRFEYDHAGRMKACWKNFNQQGEKRVTQLQYNEQGGVQSKQLGNQLETQEYATNIRGWITAINGSFVSDLNAPLPGSGGHYFGEIISYDSGYSQNMYNGNISGQRWKAAGDRVARSYGYLYDNANRLTYADFNQQNNGSSNWTKDEVDYSLSNLRYDANGNILSLSQRALKLGNSAIVDSLQYQYFANSNRLRKVSDAVDDDTPGHFRDTTATIDDYAYDVNGNIIKDQNRKMHTDAGNAGAVFNLLDKADSITIAGKSTTRYQYDVAGNLLQKTVRLQNGAAQPQELTYTYIAGFVYLNDTLQYSLMEEGCIRRVMRLNQASQQWQEQFDYEYFLKDHQGNVRSIITDGIDTAYYQATMETARQDVENALFANIYTPVQTQTNKPAGFDQDTENEKVCKLNAAPGTNHKTGPALLLKVMVGDRVQINTYAFYNQAAQQPGNGVNLLSDIMSVLPGALIGGSGGKLDAGSGSVLNGLISPNLSHFLDNDRQYDNTRPKAYLNWILLDEQFHYVAGNSGVVQVQAGTEKQALVAPEQTIGKSGYLYVFVSNESPQDVYFDDLTIRHISSPLLEEKAYMPFGLLMSSLHSKALLKQKTSYGYNGGNEWEENGLEYYNSFYRKYDAQIGRFTGVDIAAADYSPLTPYQFSANNPVMFNDPMGDRLPSFIDGEGTRPGMENLSNDLSWQRMGWDEMNGWMNDLSNHMRSSGASDFSSYWNYIINSSINYINGVVEPTMATNIVMTIQNTLYFFAWDPANNRWGFFTNSQNGFVAYAGNDAEVQSVTSALISIANCGNKVVNQRFQEMLRGNVGNATNVIFSISTPNNPLGNNFANGSTVINTAFSNVYAPTIQDFNGNGVGNSTTKFAGDFLSTTYLSLKSDIPTGTHQRPNGLFAPNNTIIWSRGGGVGDGTMSGALADYGDPYSWQSRASAADWAYIENAVLTSSTPQHRLFYVSLLLINNGSNFGFNNGGVLNSQYYGVFKLDNFYIR